MNKDIFELYKEAFERALLYHGTTLNRLKTIARDGFSVSAIRRTGNNVNAVFFTPEFNIAARYALGINKNSALVPIVIEFLPDKKYYNRMHEDPLDNSDIIFEREEGSFEEDIRELKGVLKRIDSSLSDIVESDILRMKGINLWDEAKERLFTEEDLTRSKFVSYLKNNQNDIYSGLKNLAGEIFGPIEIKDDLTIIINADYWRQLEQVQLYSDVPPNKIKWVWIPEKYISEIKSLNILSKNERAYRSLPGEFKRRMDLFSNIKQRVNDIEIDDDLSDIEDIIDRLEDENDVENISDVLLKIKSLMEKAQDDDLYDQELSFKFGGLKERLYSILESVYDDFYHEFGTQNWVKLSVEDALKL